MKEQELDGWRERQEQSAALDNIGKKLRFKLADIVAEPLPSEFHDLLKELEDKVAPKLEACPSRSRR